MTFNNFFFFILIFIIYFFSNPHLKNHYQHQVYLANSFINGHCDLTDYPSYYHDIFEVKGKKYSAFTPFPVLFLLPFTAIFGQNTNQVLINMIIGVLSAFLLYLILQKIRLSLKTILLVILAFSLGTLNWYASVIGTSWFFSHSMAVFLLFLSLFFILNQKILLSGLMFGFSLTSRYPIIAAIPAMCLLIKNLFSKKIIRHIVFFLIGTIPGFILLFGYNLCRFGNIFETGYQYANLAYANNKLVPQFSISYLSRNLYIFLFKGYDFIAKFPFLKPDPQGLSIFLTSPFLIFALIAPRKNKFFLPLWSAVLSVAIVVFSYFLTGWYQFGYRFLLDFIPFLIVLTALGMENNKSSLLKFFLIGISIIFNILGVYWGLSLGW